MIRTAGLLLGLQLAMAFALAATAFERTALKRAPHISCPSGGDVPDGQPHVALVDERRGKYAMRWVGMDGTWKEIVFFCPDRVDVTVAATVSRRADKFRYEYHVVSRDSSAQAVHGVALQTFAATIRVLEPKRGDDRYIGVLSGTAFPEFAIGKWYGVPFSATELPPGGARRIVLESEASPGLVGVRAHGGPLVMRGVGEEPPDRLIRQVPKAEVWPRGLTIGPVADVRDPEYPFGRLPACEILSMLHQAGWFGDEAFERYLRLAKNAGGNELAATMERDVSAGQAVPELRHVVRLLEQADAESGNQRR